MDGIAAPNVLSCLHFQRGADNMLVSFCFIHAKFPELAGLKIKSTNNCKTTSTIWYYKKINLVGKDNWSSQHIMYHIPWITYTKAYFLDGHFSNVIFKYNFDLFENASSLQRFDHRNWSSSKATDTVWKLSVQVVVIHLAFLAIPINSVDVTVALIQVFIGDELTFQ